MNTATLEDRIKATFKNYQKLSASTNMADDVKLESLGNHLEFLLQQYKKENNGKELILE